MSGPLDKVDEDTLSCFYEPAFPFSGTQQHAPHFWSHLVKTLTKQDFQSHFRKGLEPGDKCVQREGGDFEGHTWQYVFYCNTFLKFKYSSYILITLYNWWHILKVMAAVQITSLLILIFPFLPLGAWKITEQDLLITMPVMAKFNEILKQVKAQAELLRAELSHMFCIFLAHPIAFLCKGHVLIICQFWNLFLMKTPRDQYYS